MQFFRTILGFASAVGRLVVIKLFKVGREVFRLDEKNYVLTTNHWLSQWHPPLRARKMRPCPMPGSESE